MRIGIFGASFDPPHKAHIALAAAAYEALKLDSIVFVPAFSAPLKSAPHAAAFEDRLAMLQLALADFPHAFEISQTEKMRGGLSYSIDTAKEIAQANPAADIFWIIGADQLQQLHKWRDTEALAQLLTFAVFARAGLPLETSAELPQSLRIVKIPFDEINISSSQIRNELKNGQMCLDLPNAKVLDYIKASNLYNYG